MTKQPDIIKKSTTGNEATLELHIPEDLSYTEGHFKDHPIVPGVVLLDWALDQAMKIFPERSSPENINQIKFRKPLQPGDRCTLSLHLNPDQNTLSFEFTGGDTVLAQGSCVMPPAQSES